MEETNDSSIMINSRISLDERELDFSFIRSSGPGGQNVNKVSTAVQLRFNINESSLEDEDKQRLLNYPDKRITRNGIIIIKAVRFRTQEKNRQDAIERLAELVDRALKPVKRRKPTRMSKAAKKRRLDSKKRRSTIKDLRKRIDEF